MRDAPSTWALIVGIDTYDNVTHLTGAARDAAAAAGWLLELGVPPAQILFHAAPCAAAQSDVDKLGLTVAGCREPEIWMSFETLMKHSGPRLFVFLCGHGFFEPGGDRVFLTREASESVMKNLGIDWYAKFLRGLTYQHQFLIMDGCLNLPYTASERARFEAGAQSGVRPGTPRADVVQHFCYGASQGQRASEVDGHGLFVNTLLETLDLEQPDPNCVDIDDDEGTLFLDLERAIRDVCIPSVTAKAADLGRKQEPGIQMLSAGTTPSPLPVVRLTTPSAASVRVLVAPAGASDHVARVSMWSDDNVFNRRLPVPPARKVTLPHASRLPVGLPIAVRCTVASGGGWAQPAQQEFVTDRDRDVVFTLEPPPPPGPVEVTVNTTGSGGFVVPAMSDAAYDPVEDALGEARSYVVMERHETGPVLRSTSVAAADMWDLALDVASTVNEHTPPEISAVVHGLDAAEIQSAVELPITHAAARRLGGLLVHERIVEVGEHRVSLEDLVRDPRVEVEPGPVTIRVALPWGTWHERVVVTGATPTRVALPKEVGVPPLRVRARGGRMKPPASPPRAVIAVGSAAVAGEIVDASAEVIGTLEPATKQLSKPRTGRSASRRWMTYARVGGLEFPLSAEGAVAIAFDAEPRAEPVSWIEDENWDRLVSSGRLEDLDPRRASMLTYAKWVSPLVGLAGGYACYANDRHELLPVVLQNLARLEPELPDLAILEAALDHAQGTRRGDTALRLLELERSRAVPLFRWGVGIGVLAAEHYDLEDLRLRLQQLEPRLAAQSIWTLWWLADSCRGPGAAIEDRAHPLLPERLQRG